MNSTLGRKLGPLAALAVVALIGAGCSDAPDENGRAGNTTADYENAVRFAQCMRDNGVSEFPDPDASGGLTVDGVVNGSSLDPSTPAWKEAIGACNDASNCCGLLPPVAQTARPAMAAPSASA